MSAEKWREAGWQSPGDILDALTAVLLRVREARDSFVPMVDQGSGAYLNPRIVVARLDDALSLSFRQPPTKATGGQGEAWSGAVAAIDAGRVRTGLPARPDPEEVGPCVGCRDDLGDCCHIVPGDTSVVVAQALIDAADEIDRNTFVATDRDVTAWLRDRASRIAREGVK
ncbi:MAG TPA: hypothetical protein VJL80_06350 [Aeromicrobium sp.]|nr:hypothetical protein [Aeromicrobium sp.]HKY57640.1 hypothetical protein [Aeromicrobium sp.]